jgi:hypothetical protein
LVRRLRLAGNHASVRADVLDFPERQRLTARRILTAASGGGGYNKKVLDSLLRT